MNFQFYIEKLFESEEFEKFKKENPKAHIISGFFSVDKAGGDNKQHLDFYDPDTEKYYSFKMESSLEQIPMENPPENFQGGNIPDNLDFDFNDIENLIREKMDEKEIKNVIEKCLYSLQNKDGKNYLIATIFISKMGIIHANIDVEEKIINEFEKKSFMDMIKIFGKKDKEKKSENSKPESQEK
jgi:hypothetical protein